MEDKNYNVDETSAASTEGAAGAQGEGESEEAQEPEKKYTDADVDRIIKKKIAIERKRMQKMLDEEQQESEIEIRERNVLKRELMADAKDALVDMGLPSTLSSLMDYSNQEAYEKSFEAVTSVFNEAVMQGVKMRLAGRPPIRGTGSSSKEISREKALHDAFAPKARYGEY